MWEVWRLRIENPLSRIWHIVVTADVWAIKYAFLSVYPLFKKAKASKIARSWHVGLVMLVRHCPGYAESRV